MSTSEKLFDGKYIYTNKGVAYTEENFMVEQFAGRNAPLLFSSEVLSRVKTGEFLKLEITYLVTHQFNPIQVKIRRLLGPKESLETFDYDEKTKNVLYTFESEGKTQTFEKIYGAKPHVATPCFATSMLMVNQKKIDPVHRTPYTLLGTDNTWEYQGGIVDREVYIELQEIEPVKLEMGGRELKASHCKLLSVDESGTIEDQGHSIYLSKHFFLPYKAVFGNGLEIHVERLKSYENEFNKIKKL